MANVSNDITVIQVGGEFYSVNLTELNSLSGKLGAIDGGGTPKLAVDPTAEEIAEFDDGSIWIETS